jgi:hypothetical protein
MDAILGQDPKVVLATWNSQPREPRDVAEITILARIHASAGDGGAQKLIDQVRAFCAVDADALEGILAQEQQRAPAAAENYIRAFHRMRTDPTGTQSVLSAALARAGQLAANDRALGLRLNDALRQGFAAGLLEQRRRITRWEVAQKVGDAALIDAYAEWEPLVPWDPTMLQMRLEVYQRQGHPLAAVAAREVDEFRQWMSEPAVLRPDHAAR